ncbi:hypothetical protein OIV83_003805 [Microbotryomycetes sp. JL201]|nr:hypothetical protein OIV83_003805 [Microbotryomycetes sp. JL201]
MIWSIDGNFDHFLNQHVAHDFDRRRPALFLSEQDALTTKVMVQATDKEDLNGLGCANLWKAAYDGKSVGFENKTDTGLVAAICRHNVCLKLINLVQSGEKSLWVQLKSSRTSGLVASLSIRSIASVLAKEGCKRVWSKLRDIIGDNRGASASLRLMNIETLASTHNEEVREHLPRWLKSRSLASKNQLSAAKTKLLSYQATHPEWTIAFLRRTWADLRETQRDLTAAEKSKGAYHKRCEAQRLVHERDALQSMCQVLNEEICNVETNDLRERLFKFSVAKNNALKQAEARVATALMSVKDPKNQPELQRATRKKLLKNKQATEGVKAYNKFVVLVRKQLQEGLIDMPHWPELAPEVAMLLSLDKKHPFRTNAFTEEYPWDAPGIQDAMDALHECDRAEEEIRRTTWEVRRMLGWYSDKTNRLRKALELSNALLSTIGEGRRF